MALVNYATREINAKIVYYGPGLSGKTTNIHHVFAKVQPKNKGKLISLATQGDRTLFFDFLPVELGTVKGFKTRFHLYTVPGQVFYNSTRKLVLKGADGVVFVADSQKMMMDENLQSFENLKTNLADMGIKIDSFPVVIQYNKRDLPNAAPVEEMDQYLNPTGFPHFEASAVNGDGVLKTLTAIVKFILHDLKEAPAGQDVDFEAMENKEIPVIPEPAAPVIQAAPAAALAPPVPDDASGPRIVLKPNKVSIKSPEPAPPPMIAAAPAYAAAPPPPPPPPPVFVPEPPPVEHEEEVFHAEPFDAAEVMEEPAFAEEIPEVTETLAMPETYMGMDATGRDAVPMPDLALPEVDPALFRAMGIDYKIKGTPDAPMVEIVEEVEVPEELTEAMLHEEVPAWVNEPAALDYGDTSELTENEKEIFSKLAEAPELPAGEIPDYGMASAHDDMPWNSMPAPVEESGASALTPEEEAFFSKASEALEAQHEEVAPFFKISGEAHLPHEGVLNGESFDEAVSTPEIDTYEDREGIPEPPVAAEEPSYAEVAASEPYTPAAVSQGHQTFILPVRITTRDGNKEVILKVNVDIEIAGEGIGTIEKVEVLHPVMNKEPLTPVKKTSDESKLKPPEPERQERPKQAPVPISKPKLVQEKKPSMFHKILGMK